MNICLLLFLSLKICLDCGFAQAEGVSSTWSMRASLIIREAGHSLGLRCGFRWLDEPGSKVCSSSVQNVPVWSWKPMSGLFNSLNEHAEDTKSTNGIQPNVVILRKCTQFKIVWSIKDSILILGGQSCVAVSAIHTLVCLSCKWILYLIIPCLEEHLRLGQWLCWYRYGTRHSSSDGSWPTAPRALEPL